MRRGPVTCKRWAVLLAGPFLFLATSCQESKRLDAEILAARTELNQVQLERTEIQRELDRVHELLRAGAASIPAPDANQPPAEKEIPTLMERKKVLEAEIASLRKQMDDYKAKYH